MSTFVLIEKYTVGAGGASSVTLGSGGTIPQTYTDLLIKFSVRDATTLGINSAGFSFQIRPNAASTNLSQRSIFGSGTGVGSYTDTIIYTPTNTSSDTASTFSNDECYIPNYTSSNYKSLSVDSVAENNGSGASARLATALWSQTSAITSIQLVAYSSFVQYSTFYLYGILKA